MHEPLTARNGPHVSVSSVRRDGRPVRQPRRWRNLGRVKSSVVKWQ